MKKVVLLFLLFFAVFTFSQSTIKITTKKHIPRKGIYLQLKNVFDDSRCPENAACIWAGEVSATVAVYNDKKKIEEASFTFNSKNKTENIKWFSKYIKGTIKGIGVSGATRNGKLVNPKNYFINVVVE